MRILDQDIAAVATTVLLIAGVGLGACTDGNEAVPHVGHQHEQVADVLYQCPMHPEVTRSEPGDCPICGMRLVAVTAEAKEAKDQAPDGDLLTTVTSSSADVATSDSATHTEHIGHKTGHATVPGRAAVRIDARRSQQLGVRSVAVTRAAAQRTLRTYGVVAADEGRIYHVHSRVSGWLEHVSVYALGDPVVAGQVLVHIYSPELVATQQELLGALRAGNDAAAAAARERLRLWNVAAQDIAAIERAGVVQRTVPLRSPTDGYVHHVNALHGMAVQPDQELYTLVNLDRVWVLAKFYESELPLLNTGAVAEFTFPGGVTRVARATYIYPTVEATTRQATVRFELDNRELALRPGTSVDVYYRVAFAPALTIPVDAVIQSGEQAWAFVALGDGRFEPRALRLGAAVDGGYIVVAGLTPGERVVDRATFLVDSESTLAATRARFAGAAGHVH